ncbi:MAG: phage tail protein [Motilibacteraceae bacterium]
MPNDLVADTTLIANSFFLEIDGNPMSMLMSVSGLDVGVEVAELTQVGKDGKLLTIKTLGQKQKTGQLTLTRLAVVDIDNDGIWKWFKSTSEKGAMTAARKNGSVVMYDASHKELARYNFVNGWISKISVDGLDVSNNSPMKETITLEIDRLERVK